MKENRHLTLLSRIALLVTVGDLATKAAAKELLSGEATWFASWLHFAVVHNDQGAFGWSAGVYTWQLNLALTMAAIVFMIPVTRDLARIDPSAPRALGLIVGGALGNLASLVTSPYGVVDFIQIDLENVGVALNVADVAAYAGLAMILRTGGLLVLALRREGRLQPSAQAPVPDIFAEKAALKAKLRAHRRDDDARPVTPLGVPDIAVVDWNRVTRPIAQLADSPPSEEVEVIDIRDAGRRRGVVGEISPAPSERGRGALRQLSTKLDATGDSPER
ncbi:MAG: signal peptidase II [Gemmatimonadetes bacterium]|nr:signal peptidase II [Gemmatimonadota bacterium]HNV76324.1 signal peptidase II [Gemmatimonadaceae bacterium]MBK6842173.1 signal peptidase II [Gemmatimonadota bacterium]MBK8062271.1 signal peptidase II [Gemmatimonadota bacterium]MBK8645921.1 signal peptidase II [Gemmatimonadota bacterium]